MPVIHGRKPGDLTRVLANCREQFTDDEITWDLLADGSWSVSVSREGWMRIFDGQPEIRAAAAMAGKLAHG